MKKYFALFFVFVFFSLAYSYILDLEKKDQEIQFKQEQTEKVKQMKQANLDQYPEFFLFPYESDQIYVMYTDPKILTIYVKTKIIKQEKAINELRQYFKNNQKDLEVLLSSVELKYKKFSEIGSKYINLSIE